MAATYTWSTAAGFFLTANASDFVEFVQGTQDQWQFDPVGAAFTALHVPTGKYIATNTANQPLKLTSVYANAAQFIIDPAGANWTVRTNAALSLFWTQMSFDRGVQLVLRAAAAGHLNQTFIRQP